SPAFFISAKARPYSIRNASAPNPLPPLNIVAPACVSMPAPQFLLRLQTQDSELRTRLCYTLSNKDDQGIGRGLKTCSIITRAFAARGCSRASLSLPLHSDHCPDRLIIQFLSIQHDLDRLHVALVLGGVPRFRTDRFAPNEPDRCVRRHDRRHL